MANIIKARSASHWYHPDGSPCYEVAMATKDGMRPTNIKDARKLGLYPSVTTLQAEINKEMLNAWRVDQGILAALANPVPLPGETHDDHMRRIAIASDSVVDEARKRGVLIHEAVERFINYGEETQDTVIRPLVQPYYDWHRKNVEKVYYCEKPVVHSGVGYAGKLDAKLGIVGRGICITDFKSRKRASTGKYLVYDENGEQLVAYREADARTDQRADHCVSIIINSQEPDLHLHEWPEEQCARFWEAFQLLVKRWQILKQYQIPVAA